MTVMAQKLVVIGAGMASGRALEELFALDPDAYDVTLFGAEPRGSYNRLMLSPVLSSRHRASHRCELCGNDAVIA